MSRIKRGPSDTEEIPLSATDSEKKGPTDERNYETFFERSDASADETTLLLAGPRAVFGNEQACSDRNDQTRRRRRQRRVLSFAEQVDAITLSWHNVSVHAKVNAPKANAKSSWLPCGKVEKVERRILNDVSGVAEPGTLTAIMGASSAGKTTLLNFLSSRNLSGVSYSGNVLVNGQDLGYGIRAITAYSQQRESFIGLLRVREHLWFHAQLRMDSHIPRKDRLLRVEEVLDETGLRKCADTCIGVPGKMKGISGGEMKRLSFASEVLMNPPILLCDEPTSGLDSFMAENVISTLKGLARKGKTVLVTIHQPSSEVYQLFDNLLLMSQGRVAYMGPAREALGFFKNVGYPCPSNFSPPDHFVHQLAVTPGKEAVCQERIDFLIQKYKDTQSYRDIRLRLRQCENMDDASDLPFRARDYVRKANYKAPWYVQVWYVLWRSMTAQTRDKSITVARMLQNLVMAATIGVVYLQQDTSKQETIPNLSGAFFIFCTNQTFGNFYTVLNGLPSELNLFFREHQSGMYRVISYFLAKNLAEIPIFVITPVIFTTVTYFLIGLSLEVESFFITLAILLLVSLVAVSVGYMVATLTGSVDIALAVSPPIMLPFMLLGGYLLDLGSMPDWLAWTQYLSWFRHGYEALLYNEWSRNTPLNCTYEDNSKRNDLPCFRTTEAILQQYGLDGKNHLAMNFAALIIMVFVFRFLAFLTLYLRAKEPKLQTGFRKKDGKPTIPGLLTSQME